MDEFKTDFQALLAVSHIGVANFFLEVLQDEIKTGDPRRNKLEMVYVASVFAHYAQVGEPDKDKKDGTRGEVVRNLAELHERFILPVWQDSSKISIQTANFFEQAGSQTLLLLGLSPNSDKSNSNRRREVRTKYFEGWGQSFFYSAACALPETDKGVLLGRIAEHFHAWVITWNRISRVFQENSQNRYLIGPGN